MKFPALKIPSTPAELIPPIRAWTGPLTEELVRSPGGFGLGQIPDRVTPDDTTTMVCGFCSTGCGLNVHLKDGQAINLSADATYPVNLGMACPKGWEALTPLSAPDRGTTPLVRRRRGGPLESCDWESAMVLFCEEFKALKAKHGPESVAFLSTGQITTEEMAFLGCLFKIGMGFIHCDSNTRQCMATAHVAYKQSFGFDAPPYTYADFEESDVLVFIGSNPCIAHPIMWQRVMRNPHSPEILVVDPRATETAMAATQHYAIQPKSDLTLLYGLAHLLIEMDAVRREFIEAHTTGFEEFAEFVRAFSPRHVSAAAGISEERLRHFAQTIADGKRVSFWWTMGVNQGHESTRTAQAIINLALMTGSIGRPGTGANSITGQCNAMGSRIFANITSLLGAHDANDDADRAKIAGILGIDESAIPREPSMAYDEIVRGIAEGKIKGLWVIATNSSHSWIHQSEFNALLERLDFLVVQDLYSTTETAQRADLFLPAAGWGEKEGTLINSERRIGLIKKIRRAPGQALSDFHICQLIAHYWGCAAQFARWTSPEAAFALLKEVSRNQPNDMTGIRDYHHIDAEGGIQWPLPEASLSRATHSIEHGQEHDCENRISTERRLFEDGRFFTPDGRARFLFDEPRAMPEPPDDEYPFILLTGRGTSSQWHTNTRTGKSDVLRKLYPAHCYVEIHPTDARRLGIRPNSPVQLASRRAKIRAAAFVTPTVQPGQIFVPMHYREVNTLTFPAFDPHSRQPAYKACAVSVAAL
ncbi:MAG: molybdopterin oxidoreductase family protein [Terrimicrobiaceae bacterium]|nr:molybdopterin oxidoreductase family protein [Terrimicrobiaceae bacterium]